MQQKTYDRLIYSGALIPLTAGTVTFLYWYCQKHFRAINTNIELVALIDIIIFLILSPVTLILCIFYVKKFTKNWKRIVPAVCLALFTIPAIIAYGDTYDLTQEKTFIRIVNDDASVKVNRIWSKHFERPRFEDGGNDFIVSYEPVYIYDRIATGSGDSAYAISEVTDVFIDLITKDNKIKTVKFPELKKGDCRHFKVSELVSKEMDIKKPAQ